jgi:hypothetical protein
LSFKFLFIISNWYNKSILNNYVSRSFQWYKKYLIWMMFTFWTFLLNIQELALGRNVLERKLLPTKLKSFSHGEKTTLFLPREKVNWISFLI